jgi:predicted pyridoxine 5'-phosphate oxidase superfamily flavin-nucleotide-binding protein
MRYEPAPAPGRHEPPGSAGEKALQQRLGTSARAQRFYDEQVLDHLNPAMRDFVRRQRMMFVATADKHGECDNSLRAGPPGFVEIIGPRTLAWPEYRGNGVMASIGNISENPNVGILMVDFIEDTVGLHVNGRARLVEDAQMREAGIDAGTTPASRTVAIWVEVTVEEAYIHCSKHIPRFAEVDPETGEPVPSDAGRRRKTADYFGSSVTAPLEGDVAAVEAAS